MELKINGISINYTVEGDGFAVVLLHGFMESLQIWEAFSTELARDFKCICIDLPGHGQSGMLAEVHSMELMADTVKHVLDAEDIAHCILVGHSMGGYVSLAFANKYPKMMRGLALFHSTSLADNEEARRNRQRTIEIVKENKHGFIAEFIRDLFAEFNVEKYRNQISSLIAKTLLMKPEAIIAALAGMRDRQAHLGLLTEVTYPVLFIGGKHDKRIAADKLVAQAMLPYHAELLLLGNCGHMGFIEAQDETLKAIKFFAERIYY